MEKDRWETESDGSIFGEIDNELHARQLEE